MCYNKAHMLSQRHRFHGHGSLRYVYKHGESVRGRVISLKYTTNPRRQHSRISVVVSKKVMKSAVGRNRIRRRVYEVMRELLPSLDATGTYDVAVLVFSSEVATMPHDELRTIIRSQCKAAGMLS